MALKVSEKLLLFTVWRRKKIGCKTASAQGDYRWYWHDNCWLPVPKQIHGNYQPLLFSTMAAHSLVGMLELDCRGGTWGDEAAQRCTAVAIKDFM